MQFQHILKHAILGASLLAVTISSVARAETADDTVTGEMRREIIVTGTRATYNNNEATEPMIQLQTPLTSPLSMIDNLPGVTVNEGDTFGFDDWSTTVSLRGFQTNLDEQQVGMTIDGLPNGGSNYGGGAKANRYIDSMSPGQPGHRGYRFAVQ